MDVGDEIIADGQEKYFLPHYIWFCGKYFLLILSFFIIWSVFIFFLSSLCLHMFQLGAGSFLLRHFSMLVNSIMVSFGLSEEMHNPVSVLFLSYHVSIS